MKKTLEKLWNEYLLDENAAVSKYVDSLCEMNSLFAKKAFFTGCEFTFSFFFEAGNFKH